MKWCKMMMEEEETSDCQISRVSIRLSKIEEGPYGVNLPKQLTFVSNYRIVSNSNSQLISEYLRW